MAPLSANVIICGAGIAGVATAYALAVSHGLRDIVLIDEAAPLSLTSDKSTECYRNWWPGPDAAMVQLMNRSIDLLEAIAHASNNSIGLNRRGYLYATANPAHIPTMLHAARETSALGAGPLRVYGNKGSAVSGQRAGGGNNPNSISPALPAIGSDRSLTPDPRSLIAEYTPAPAHGFEGQPDGADLLLDQGLIRQHYPALAEQTVALLHTRRCGWFSAQQLGMWLLDQARAHGVRLLRGRVTGIDTHGGRVQSVTVAQEGGSTSTMATGCFISAAGPFQGQIGQMLGIELPLFSERHIKIAFNDPRGVVPRDAGLLIWEDPLTLPWSDDERAALADDPATRHLLEPFPPGVHGRPEGGGQSTTVLLLWTYDLNPVEPIFPLPVEPYHAEVVIRGMSAMLPGLAAYTDRLPKCYIDGGYYTKTRENRPLIGPLPIAGAYISGAFSGFGLMAACAAGELLAAHMTGARLPAYAPAFTLARYNDPAYRKLLETWGASGQL